MAKLEVEIPEELRRDFESLSDIDVSFAMSRVLKTELERLARLKGIVSKSKLTEKDAKLLSSKVDESLAKRFRSAQG